MLIAKERRKSNIVEYILYMYQIEDIIRSFQFDLDRIDEQVVQKYDQSENIKQQIKDWYKELIRQMEQESIHRKGHLNQLKELISELQSLHQQMLTTIQDKEYIKVYDQARPILKDLTLKVGSQELSNEVDVALHGLYGLLMLRLKKQTVTEETQSAMKKVSDFLALLAFYYHQRESGQFEFSRERQN